MQPFVNQAFTQGDFSAFVNQRLTLCQNKYPMFRQLFMLEKVYIESKSNKTMI